MHVQERTSIYVIQTARVDESVELDRPVGLARDVANETEAGGPI